LGWLSPHWSPLKGERENNRKKLRIELKQRVDDVSSMSASVHERRDGNRCHLEWDRCGPHAWGPSQPYVIMRRKWASYKLRDPKVWLQVFFLLPFIKKKKPNHLFIKKKKIKFLEIRHSERTWSVH
jgi:hypothetical protein